MSLSLINNQVALIVNWDALALLESSQSTTAIVDAWKEFIVKLLKLGNIFLQVFSDQILNIGFSSILRWFFHHIKHVLF